MPLNQFERASLAWPILVSVAASRQVITYGDLASQLGLHHRAVQFFLGVIQDYCLDEPLPPLTVLVVNQQGIPGSGFIGCEVNDLPKVREQVWDFDWKSLANPFSFAETGVSHDDLINTLCHEPSASGEVYVTVKNRGMQQRLFREALVKVYQKKCAFTEFSFVNALEACHIVPWSLSSAEERLDIRNGILLNRVHHKLFDDGLITINQDHIIVTSEFADEKILSKMDKQLVGKLDGRPMHVPHRVVQRPSADYIQRHHELMNWELD